MKSWSLTEPFMRTRDREGFVAFLRARSPITVVLYGLTRRDDFAKFAQRRTAIWASAIDVSCQRYCLLRTEAPLVLLRHWLQSSWGLLYSFSSPPVSLQLHIEYRCRRFRSPRPAGFCCAATVTSGCHTKDVAADSGTGNLALTNGTVQ